MIKPGGLIDFDVVVDEHQNFVVGAGRTVIAVFCVGAVLDDE
jgi:hypothetical protein